MKKYLLLLLFLSSFTLSAQLFSCDFSSIRDEYRATVKKNITEIRGSDGCINEVKFEFILPKLLETREDGLEYYYGYNIELEGHKLLLRSGGYDPSTKELLLNKNVYPVTYEDGGYSLSVTISKEMIDKYLRKGLDNDTYSYSIDAYLYLTKYIFMPAVQVFLPCTWDYPVFSDGISNVSECLNPNDDSKPDLQFVKSDVLIKDGCRTCRSYYPINGHSFELYNKHESILGFYIPIINSGLTASSNTKLTFYSRHFQTIGGWITIKLLEVDIPPLLPGETVSLGSIFIDGHHKFNQFLGRNFILMQIDHDNNIHEYNEFNNELEFSVTYRSKDDPDWWEDDIDIDWIFDVDPWSGNPDSEPFTFEDNQFKINEITNELKIKEYDLDIYNLYGKLIKKVIIKDERDVKDVVRNLPNGLYILNSINGSRKVYVQN